MLASLALLTPNYMHCANIVVDLPKETCLDFNTHKCSSVNLRGTVYLLEGGYSETGYILPVTFLPEQ